MCGRMTIATDQAVLEARFHATMDGKIEKHYNAYPNHDRYKLPVITEDDSEHITLRWWGLLPRWWTRDARGLINIQYETLRDKKTFHKDLAERRCLVLADGFYEWKGERGHKTPYYIHLKSGEAFAFAGLYEDNSRDGSALPTFAIITTAPNELMAPIHSRMPVILGRDDESLWVNPATSLEQALSVLEHPLSAEEMEAYEVSKAINRPGTEGETLREPV
jgi:putative SOS response-associated peptidase YedK